MSDKNRRGYSPVRPPVKKIDGGYSPKPQPEKPAFNPKPPPESVGGKPSEKV